MEKLFYSGTFSIALLENGTFYLISGDHNQPIKQPEFNKVLYNQKYQNFQVRSFEKKLVSPESL